MRTPITYGLLLALGTTLAAAPALAAFPACTLSLTSIDTSNVPIGFVRMALRADGRPLLVFNTDMANDTQLLVHDCANLACSSGTSYPFGYISSRFGDSGVVIRADNRPLLTTSYYGGLRLYDCNDASCLTASPTDIVAQSSAIRGDLPMLLQASGNPLLLYTSPFNSATPGALIAHFCDDVPCTGPGRDVLLATPPPQSQFAAYALALGAQGNPVASYLVSDGASTSYGNMISVCSGEPACSTITTTQISAPTGRLMPWHTALAIRSDARPLVLDNRTNDPALLDCDTPACTSVTRRSLPAAAGQPLGLALMAGDRPAFARYRASLMSAWACDDAQCTSGSEVAITTSLDWVRDGDFKLDASQRPVITWINGDTRALWVARCLSDALFANGFD